MIEIKDLRNVPPAGLSVVRQAELGSINAQEKINIFNLGTNEYCQVNDSIAWICEHLGLKPTLTYSGGERGWIGDNPFIFLDTQKICSLGWKPKLSIKEGVIKTVEYLQSNYPVLEKRV